MRREKVNMATTLEKVRRLEEYLATSNVTLDPVLDITINKILVRELNRITEIKTRLENQLAEFEERYALQSGDFYKRYESGELGDAIDFVEWASTIEMLTNLQQQIAILEHASN